MKIDIKQVKLSEIKLNPDNPRTINNSEMKLLIKSLQEFPEMMQLREIVVDETMTVLGGNMRTLALRKAGIKTVTAKICTGLTAEQKREFVIKDNGSMGTWDMDALANGWGDLPLTDWGVDLPDDWLNSKSESHEDDFDADAALDEIKEPITKKGDVWLLGKHRVMCGDSTKKEDVDRLMAGKLADMVFTDPPYGVSYADKNKYLNTISPGNRIQVPIENDHKSVEELANTVIYPTFCNIKEILSKRSSYYITAPQGGDLLMMMMMMMQKAGLILRHMIIWVKNNHVLGRTDYNYKHEPILFGWCNVHDFYGKGEFKFSTWEINKPHKSDLHPTMKPVQLVANAINNSTKENELITDLFLGSGTTLIAAEQLGRICYGMEIDPLYCDVICQRWEKLTGKKAVLENEQ